MNKFVSNRLSKLVPYVPGEQPQDKKYIKLNTNESPFPPTPLIKDMIEGEVDDLRLYSDPESKILVSTLAKYYGLKDENVFVANGSDELLAFAFMVYCGKDKGIAFPNITYGFYEVYADLYGITPSIFPLKSDFSIDVNDYINVKKNVIIANPNAQTGLALPLSDIEKIVKSNRDYAVIIDEAYVDFGAETALPLLTKYDNLLIIRTMSKSRSLAGMRIGYALGSKALIDALQLVKYSFNSYNVDRLGNKIGALGVLDEDYFQKCTREIIRVREEAKAALRELGLTVTDSKANFFLARDNRLSGKELYTGLREKGILVRYFANSLISDYVRISIGNENQMKALVQAIKELKENK